MKKRRVSSFSVFVSSKLSSCISDFFKEYGAGDLERLTVLRLFVGENSSKQRSHYTPHSFTTFEKKDFSVHCAMQPENETNIQDSS